MAEAVRPKSKGKRKKKHAISAEDLDDVPEPPKLEELSSDQTHDPTPQSVEVLETLDIIRDESASSSVAGEHVGGDVDEETPATCEPVVKPKQDLSGDSVEIVQHATEGEDDKDDGCEINEPESAAEVPGELPVESGAFLSDDVCIESSESGTQGNMQSGVGHELGSDAIESASTEDYEARVRDEPQDEPGIAVELCEKQEIRSEEMTHSKEQVVQEDDSCEITQSDCAESDNAVVQPDGERQMEHSAQGVTDVSECDMNLADLEPQSLRDVTAEQEDREDGQPCEKQTEVGDLASCDSDNETGENQINEEEFAQTEVKQPLPDDQFDHHVRVQDSVTTVQESLVVVEPHDVSQISGAAESSSDVVGEYTNAVRATAPVQEPEYPPATDALPKAMPTAPLVDVRGDVMLAQTPATVSHPVLDVGILENVGTMKPFTKEQLRSLYYNEQLDGLERFIESFLQLPNYESHAFYEILMNNLRARNKLRTAELDLRTKQADYERLHGLVWSTTTHTMTVKGVCKDKVHVTEQHMYEKVVFHENVCADITRVLGNIRTDLHDDLSLHAYSAQLSRLQVESFIHNLIVSSQVLSDIPRNAPVVAFPPNQVSYEGELENLRICICILFGLQRRPHKDETFQEDTRLWLDRLIGVFLRVASFSDHMFLLCQVLRCPAGVGQWGAKWVQPPILHVSYNQTQFGSPVLDHFLAMLAIVLLPIRGREDYLRQLGVDMTPERTKCNPWTLVDSEGEEEDEDPSVTWKYLLENDLVAILNQFNMETMYMHVLFIDREDREEDRLIYDVKRTSEHSMMRLFAFSTALTELIGRGLENFTQTRYRQLNKRLGNMIRKTVCFVSDHWENFRTTVVLPVVTMTRLQVEFDEFFLRSFKTILSAQRLGSWQFISDMPFSSVSIGTMWKLVWLLHFGKSEEMVESSKCRSTLLVRELILKEVKSMRKTWDENTRREFDDILSRMSTSESVYLLTALAGMAQGRPAKDRDFVQTIVEEIYEIAYVSPHTREFCSKTGRELLSCIASVHPFIMSDLLLKVRESVDKVGFVSLYLFSELPLLQWQITNGDMEIIQSWLLDRDLSSADNQLARLILSGVNWGFNEQQNALFLPLSLHYRVGRLLVEVHKKHVTSKAFAMIADGVKQVASSVSKNVTSDQQQFVAWLWQVALRLRLHKNSQSRTSTEFVNAPDLKQDPLLSRLQLAVQDGIPLACYIALMMASTGHSHVEFCCDGLSHLHTLVSQSHYQAAIQVLSSIAPLFYNQSHYLIGNERFSKILQSLLSTDPAYTTYAMSFLFNIEIPEQVTKFICMVQAQLQMVSSGDCDSSMVLDFWIKALVGLNKWYTDKNILCCVDSLLRAAFVTKGGDKVASDTIFKAYEDMLRGNKGQNVLSTFMSWLATGSATTSFLDKISSADYPWFAYFVLLAETQWETETRLWPSLLEELVRNPRSNLDQTVKKICTNLKLENGPSLNRLCIYRWANVAMEIELGHPVSPLLWQNFFFLFLQRPVIDGVVMKSSVGEAFFESTVNVTLMKKLKKRLSDVIEHHHHEATKTSVDDSAESDSEGATALPENVRSSVSADFHTKLISLYQSFKLWLDEPRLHDGNLYLPGLPVQYAAERLQRIFQGDKNPWFEFVDMDKVEYTAARSVEEWMTKIFPVSYGNLLSSGFEPRTVTATDRILTRLSQKTTSLPPPVLLPLKAPVPDVPVQLLTDGDNLILALKSDFTEIINYAKSFSHRVSKHIELDCNYEELMPDLYGNEMTQVDLYIPCRRSFKPGHTCDGPAEVRVRYEEKRCREIVKRRMDENRIEYKELLCQSFLPPHQSVCTAAVHVENAITDLITHLKAQDCDSRTAELITHAGRTLFYHVVLLVSDITNHYPPCRQFFSSCVEVLGQEFIANHRSETSRLLLTILSTPLLAGNLAVHFTPSASPREFIHLYEKVVPTVATLATDTAFMLFTKFDIQQWLITYTPVLSERRQFAALLVDVMCICGAQPEDRLLKVLEIAKTHLDIVVLHQFPELYADVLVLLLKGSCEGHLHPNVWDKYMVTMGCKSYPTCGHFYQQSLHDHPNSVISLQQVLETLEWLANYFQQARTAEPSHEPFGLYPRWSHYLKPVACVIGYLCGILITRGPASFSISNHNPESVLSRIWGEVIRVFSPWIAPLDRGAVTHCAWVESDSESAGRFVTVFVEAALLLHRQFEGSLPVFSHNIPSLVFDYYSKQIACPGCPEYVLQVFHFKFARLPWNQFRPSVDALDYMTKLCDQSHPNSPGKYSCLQFLASIAPSLPWGEMVQFYAQYEPPEITMRFHAHLLQLLVQIFLESSVLQLSESQVDSLSMLALDAEQFYWHFLDDVSYKSIIEIFLLNCDPRCVLAERTATVAQALRLLRLAAGFMPLTGVQVHAKTFEKQRCFIQSYVRLIAQCTRLSNSHLGAVQLVLTNLLTDCETVLSSVNSGHPEPSNCVAVMGDIMCLLNTCDPNDTVISSVLTTIIQWLESSPCSVLLLPTISAVTKTLTSIPMIVQITESCIESHLNSGSVDWAPVLMFLDIPQQCEDDYLSECLTKECYLTVFTRVLHQLSLCESLTDEKAQLVSLVEWTIKIKPSSANEAKLILWFHKVSQLCLRQAQHHCNARPLLELFIPAVVLLGEDKSTAGFLGTLGLGKRSQLSIRFRLFCKSLSMFLLAQLPNDSSVRFDAQAPGHVSKSVTGIARPTQKALQAMAGLLGLKGKKEYRTFVTTIDFVSNYTNDRNHSLNEVLLFISHLASVLFSEVKYLSVLRPAPQYSSEC